MHIVITHIIPSSFSVDQVVAICQCRVSKRHVLIVKGGYNVCMHERSQLLMSKRGLIFLWWWQASFLFLFQSLTLIPSLTHTFLLLSLLYLLHNHLSTCTCYMRVFVCESVSRFLLLCRSKNLSPLLIPNIVPSRAESLVI